MQALCTGTFVVVTLILILYCPSCFIKPILLSILLAYFYPAVPDILASATSD